MDIDKYEGLREVLLIGKSTGIIQLQDPPRKVRLLSHQMLRGEMRGYIIDKVKKPLMKAITVLANRYPEPTRDNCINPNSLLLLDIQDKFFEYETNFGRIGLFKAIFRIFIGEYEHDPYYRARINWFFEEIVELTMNGKWAPRGMMRPLNFWQEEQPYGFYERRKFKKLINRGENE